MTASFEHMGFDGKKVDDNEAQMLMSILSLTLHKSYPDSETAPIDQNGEMSLPRCPKALQRRRKKKHSFNS